MNPLAECHLAATLQVENHGTPEEQKEALVNAIMDAFQNPQQWPTTDADRITLLRKLYGMAYEVRRTERMLARKGTP